MPRSIARSVDEAPSAERPPTLWFLVDFQEKDAHLGPRLAEALRRETGMAVELVGGRFVLPNSPMRRLRRVAQSLVFPLGLIGRLRPGDHVLCWQQNFGIALAFGLRLFRPRAGAALHLMHVITTGARRRWPFRGLIGYALGYDGVRSLFVDAPVGAETLTRLYGDRIGRRALTLHKIHEIDPALVEPGPPPPRGDFFLSAGRSNRRFDRLVEVFRRRPDQKLIIVNETLRPEGMPANVIVEGATHGADYIALLRRAGVAVIDLADPEVSAGHLSFVDALRFGTPLLVRRSPAFEGYAIEGRNCLCFDDEAELEAALETLLDPTVRERMSAFQIADYAARFSIDDSVRQIAAAIGRSDA